MFVKNGFEGGKSDKFPLRSGVRWLENAGGRLDKTAALRLNSSFFASAVRGVMENPRLRHFCILFLVGECCENSSPERV
jgi:hypothetical protein